jgi:ribonuclease G
MCERSNQRVAALLVDGQLSHLVVEHSVEANVGRTGLFLSAEVQDVVSSLEAIFLDAGLKRPVFLKFADYELAKSVQQLRKGERLLVQLMSEAQSGKGARVTMHYQMAGQFLVYLPNADYQTISNRILDDAERQRLLQWVDSNKQDREGWIVRSLASGVEDARLLEDMEQLRARWVNLTSDFTRRPRHVRPGVIDEGESFAERMMVRFAKTEPLQIMVDAEIALSLLQNTKNVVIMESKQKEAFIKELERFVKPYVSGKIRLAGGGLVICEQTTALTVIDVDSGRTKSTFDLAETALRVNLQATAAIAKWLRISDTGGMVVIDFVHMDSEAHRQAVEEALRDACGDDLHEVQLVGWSGMGLFELTRKRTSARQLKDFFA